VIAGCFIAAAWLSVKPAEAVLGEIVQAGLLLLSQPG